MLTEFVVVDLEMTGLKPSRDKILEIGAVHRKDGQTVAEYATLVNPGVPIPQSVTDLTGITREMAENGIGVREAVEGFLEFMGQLPLAGHNIFYDYSFLKHNAVNHNLTFEAQVVDTWKLSRKLFPDLEKKSLEAMCEYFGICRKQEHRALADAQATAELLEKLLEMFGESHPKLFCPESISYKVKKQGPITPRQKKYLKELAEYHKIELLVAVDSLTRNEASRLTDKILSQYGKMQ